MNGLENILRVYESADEIDRSEGLLAYSRYNAVCRSISERFLVPFEIVVAVFAATSPNNDYKGNLRSTLSVLDGWTRGWTIEDINVSCYRHCAAREKFKVPINRGVVCYRTGTVRKR